MRIEASRPTSRENANLRSCTRRILCEMDQNTEHDWVERARQGEPAALAELYRRYWRAARATAYGVTGDYGRDCTWGKISRRKVPTPSKTIPTALAARKM